MHSGSSGMAAPGPFKVVPLMLFLLTVGTGQDCRVTSGGPGSRDNRGLGGCRGQWGGETEANKEGTTQEARTEGLGLLCALGRHLNLQGGPWTSKVDQKPGNHAPAPVCGDALTSRRRSAFVIQKITRPASRFGSDHPSPAHFLFCATPRPCPAGLLLLKPKTSRPSLPETEGSQGHGTRDSASS